MAEGEVTESKELFTVIDRWGNPITLTNNDWTRIVAKHPVVEPYVELVRTTLERPNVVFEGKHPDTKAFYAKGLLTDHPFRGCYVAVLVRYNVTPATIRTVYFPINIEASLGNVLHIDRDAGGG